MIYSQINKAMLKKIPGVFHQQQEEQKKTKLCSLKNLFQGQVQS